uniref:Uncharacterized protein n=1 Tax=Arundo donax TaxID=35708 RepID=A0A0A8YV36_ARUDO
MNKNKQYERPSMTFKLFVTISPTSLNFDSA